MYSTPGTYAVTLRAANAAGTSEPVTGTVTVTAPPPGAGVVRAGAGTSAVSNTGGTAVSVPVPAGVTTGDLLIAQITADNAPAMSGVPEGWSPVVAPMSVASNARVFVYSYVVTGAVPGSVTWQLSSAQKWGAGMAAFSGVDPAQPFDSPASTAKDTSYQSTRLTVPGVQTVTAGALLVGGVGLDSKSAVVTSPADWTEAAQNTGGQISQLAWQPRPDAGVSGQVTWSLDRAAASAGWIRALRPAHG
jgi:hypothetical protein